MNVNPNSGDPNTLVARLVDPDRHIRLGAFSRVAEMSKDEREALALQMYEGNDIEYRVMAVRLMQSEKPLRSTVRRILLNDPSAKVRMRAYLALKRDRSGLNLGTLREMLKDPFDKNVQLAVCEVYMEWPHRAKELLIPLLNHPVSEVRFRVVEGLLGLGYSDPDMHAVILELKNDPWMVEHDGWEIERQDDEWPEGKVRGQWMQLKSTMHADLVAASEKLLIGLGP